MLLLAACRVVEATSIYELGCSMGATTLNLALNLPGAHITTVDIARQPIRDYDGALRPDGTPFAASITELTLDTFTWEPPQKVADLVFVDAAHDYDSVVNDTQLAILLSASQHLACIAWHDYNNPAYPDVTRFLDKLSSEQTICHVEDSQMCFWFNDWQDERVKGIINA